MSLTQDEMRKALQMIQYWPKEKREELARLTPNEREMMMLASALLNARPE
jgi:hypothetical protein